MSNNTEIEQNPLQGEEAIAMLMEISANIGRSSLKEDIAGERGETPSFSFLTKVLDHLSMAYPHEEGDKSENEKKYLTVKRQVRNDFYKEFLPRIDSKLRDYIVIPMTKSTQFHIKFNKPTKAAQ